MSRFKSVVCDVDSTLSGIEGIDWLASLRGKEVENWSSALTAKAMAGEIALDAVYGQRLNLVKPNRQEVAELAKIYISRIARNARETIAALQAEQVDFAMVSGGLREAILPLAEFLGVNEKLVRAVAVYFDEVGRYRGFDEASPLTRQQGKPRAVREMDLDHPILAIGDGMTDLEMKPAVDAFAAYTGFARRQHVVEEADFVIDDFGALKELVLQ